MRINRRLPALILVAVLFVPAVPAAAAPTDAGTQAVCADAQGGSHCYWTAQWPVSPPSGFTGASTNIHTVCLLVSQASPNYFATNELWVTNGGDWIESGIVYGHPLGRPSSQGGLVYFWGDDRPGTGFSGHYSTTQFPLDSSQRMAIIRRSARTWDVRTGPITGRSTSSLVVATRLDTGMETYVNNSNTLINDASSSAMTWYDLSGAARTGWTTGTKSAFLNNASGAGRLRWAHQYDWIQYGNNSCLASAPAPALPKGTVTPTDLTSLAFAVASQSGEPAPTALTMTRTRRSAALSVVTPGNTVSEDGDSIVVTMQGTFVGTSAPRPPGMAAPTGSVLSIVVDAPTMQVTDIALGDKPVDLRALGTEVHNL